MWVVGRWVWSRVRAGHLHPVHRGVYAVGHPNPPVRGRFLGAVKACGPTAVLSTSWQRPSTEASPGTVAGPDHYPRASKLSRVIASGLPQTRSELEDALRDLIRLARFTSAGAPRIQGS
jgi:hypothetical protein